MDYGITILILGKPMRVVSLAFLVVNATTAMVITAIWATAATFGLLQSPVITMRGIGSCITIPQDSAGTTTVKKTDFQSVVSKTKPIQK